MKRIITLSLSSDDALACHEPSFDLGPRSRRRTVLLPKLAFDWYALFKRYEGGEDVQKPTALAEWMYKNGARDEELAKALVVLFKSEIARMLQIEANSEEQKDLQPVEVLANFIDLTARLEINSLIRPEGAVAQAMAEAEVNYVKLYDFVDGLRSYILFQLTSLAESESGQLQLPLTDLWQSDQEVEVG